MFLCRESFLDLKFKLKNITIPPPQGVYQVSSLTQIVKVKEQSECNGVGEVRHVKYLEVQDPVPSLTKNRQPPNSPLLPEFLKLTCKWPLNDCIKIQQFQLNVSPG